MPDNKVLIERAISAVEAHKAAYYNNGDYYKADFWDYAEIFEIIEDLYEVTGDKSYFLQFSEMYDYIIRRYTADWHDNPFNDDIMWLTIALTRAYLYTGDQKYLDTAAYNFNKTYARAVSDDLGGGLFWRIENKCKNTCVNCPAAIAAGLLAKATSDNSYYSKMKTCLDWTVHMMFEPDTGKVYDCINLDGSINRWSSTYNQGTFIGACIMYYQKTNQPEYLAYADKAADYVKTVMYNNGIMNNEENGNDLPGFKGILARYIRRYADLTNKNEYRDWLQKNAEACWLNRNTHGIMWTQLSEKTSDTIRYDVFSASAAVSVVVNSANTII